MKNNLGTVNTSILHSKVFFLFFMQGRLDALWALLRRQYDRVSLMRPTTEDKVGHRNLVRFTYIYKVAHRHHDIADKTGTISPKDQTCAVRYT